MTTLLGLSIAESTFNIVFLSYSDFLNMASANDILSVETRFIIVDPIVYSGPHCPDNFLPSLR